MQKNKLNFQDVKFPQQCRWKFKFSGILHSVDW